MKKFYFFILTIITFCANGQSIEGVPVSNVRVLEQPENTISNPITNNSNVVNLSIASQGGVPTGNSNVVGVTKGELSVSPTGSAVYNIPLTIPPGIMSTVPEIGLSYNSSNGNGDAGYGWNISGISSISRIPSTKFHDNIIDPVDYDSYDRYALDGQRLILKSGTYGGNGSTYETENFSNLKITAVGTSTFGSGPEYFKVEYPDGGYAYYGNRPSSSTRNEWFITYFKNPIGAYISYNYNIVNNTARIWLINYRGLDTEEDMNGIYFVYKNRYRPEESYVGGYKVLNDKILSEINITSSRVPYRNYYLNHDVTSLGYERLISIIEKNGDNTQSYNPTIFSYPNTVDEITYNSLNTATLQGHSQIQSDNSEVVTADYTGEGNMDFILYATSGSLNKNKYWIYTDINAIGSQMTIEHNSGVFEKIFPVTFLTHNSKFNPYQGWTVIKNNSGDVEISTYCLGPIAGAIYPQGSFTISSNSIGGNVERKYYSGDFNGDGLTDIIIVNKNTGQSYFIDLDRRLTNHLFNAGLLYSSIADADKLFIADYNGDGKADLFHFKETLLRVYSINNTNTYSLLTALSDSHISVNRDILLGDYNGDGKIDFIIPKEVSSNEYRKFISTGSSYYKTIEIIPQFYYAGSSSAISRYFMPTDYNNDGKSDLLLIRFGGQGVVDVRCYLNKNGSFSGLDGGYTQRFENNASGIDRLAIPILVNSGRLNNKIEFAAIRDNKIHYFKSNKDFSQEKLLTSITIGNGVKETITYNPLVPYTSNLSTYTIGAGTGELYPFFGIYYNPGVSVVSEFNRYSAQTSAKQVYRYRGAVTSLDGRGFLGFQTTTKTNWFQDNSEVVSNLIQYDINKRGAVIEDYTLTGWSDLSSPANYITKTVMTYEDELLANKVYKIKKTSTVEFNSLKNTSNTTSLSYDEYLNITGTSITTKLGSTVEKTGVSTFEYENNPTAATYIVGRMNKKNTSTSFGGSSMTSEEIYSYTNNLLTQVKKKGHNTEYITEDNEYDERGNILTKTISVPGLEPRVTSYEYDPTGRFMTKFTDVDGLETTYTTDPYRCLLTSTTTPNGITTSYFYDGFAKQTKITDYLGKNKIINYSVQPYGMYEENVTNDDGSATFRKFDDLGREIIRGEKNLDDSWSYVKTDYDKYDRIIGVSQPYGSLGQNPSQYTTTSYDIYGRVAQVNEYTGKVITYSYNGLTTNVNDGISTHSITKNSVDDVVSKTDAGGTINYSYFPNSTLKQTEYDGVLTTIEQDGWGRKIKLTDPSAGVSEYEYNQYGELTKEITPKGTTSYVIGNTGKVLEKTVVGDLTNNKTTYTYDASSKLLTFMLYEDLIEGFYSEYTYEYDQYKRLWRTGENTFAGFYQTATFFDDFGRPDKLLYTAIHSETGKSSSRWIQQIYKNGKLWKINDFDNSHLIWQANSVNSRGQITHASFPNGVNTTYSYDTYGFPQSSYTGIGSLNIVSLGYTFNERTANLETKTVMLHGENSNWTENYRYDSLDRLVEYPNAFGQIETQSYDNKGRITSSGVGNYSYDNTKVYQQSQLDMSASGEAHYKYKEGVFTSNMESRKDWLIPATGVTYDSTEKHSGHYSLKVQNTGSSPLTVEAKNFVTINDANSQKRFYITGYIYSTAPEARIYLIAKNAAGNVISSSNYVASNTVGEWSIVGRLVSVPAETKYLSVSLTTQSAGTAWFDDIQIKRSRTKENRLNVSYNALNNPVEIFEHDTDRIYYTYNAAGQRYTMYYGSTAVDKYQRPLRKHYSIDGSMEIKYNQLTGQVEFLTYITGDPYSSPAVLKSDGTNSEYLFLHRDYQGSIIAITDQTGAVVEKRRFDAWGNIQLVQDGYGNDLRGLTVLDRGYTGHEHLQSVMLIHMNGRIYDPVLHRFIQPDNFIQNPDDTQNYNRYAYVLNNPLKYVDINGESFGSWWSANWKSVVTIAAVVIVTVAVTVLTAGMGTVAAGFMIGAAGGFTGAALGTALNGGSVSDVLISGIGGALVGGLSGALGGGLASYAPKGIIPGALFGSFSNYTISGLSNVMTGKDFNENAGMSLTLGFITGGGVGFRSARESGANIWTGAAVKAKPQPSVIPSLTEPTNEAVEQTADALTSPQTQTNFSNSSAMSDMPQQGIAIPAVEDALDEISINSNKYQKVYQHGLEYADRVRARGVQDPVSHNFPYSFDDAILSTNPIPKSNGYQIYQLKGFMNDKRGVFEIGVTRDNVIDHRFFRPLK